MYVLALMHLALKWSNLVEHLLLINYLDTSVLASTVLVLGASSSSTLPQWLHLCWKYIQWLLSSVALHTLIVIHARG